MELWLAFLVGLGGSFHCVGMCGPIALALPQQNRRRSFILGRLFYNAGRITTYMLLGAICGTLGYAIHWTGLRQSLSILLGITLILGVALPALGHRFGSMPGLPWLRRKLADLLRTHSQSTLYMVGILNGLLPCGFLYIGLIGALTMNGPWQGAGYMAAFGMGTLPLMLLASLSGRLLRPQARQWIPHLLRWGVAALGVLLIIRGVLPDVHHGH
jgi:hypothetical protein